MEHYWVGIQSEGGITGEDVVVLAYNAPAAYALGLSVFLPAHDDYAEDMVLDRRENLHLLVKTVLWRGEPFRTAHPASGNSLASGRPAYRYRTRARRSAYPLWAATPERRRGALCGRVCALLLRATLNPSGQPLWRQSVPMTLRGALPRNGRQRPHGGHPAN